MRFHLVIACAAVALAAPVAQADPPIPPEVEEVLHLLDGNPPTLEDYCVYEQERDGTRGDKVVCAPAGSLPELEIRLDDIIPRHTAP